jgi:ribosomal protein L40E
MEDPGTPEKLAAYMFYVRPVVCPHCSARNVAGAKKCEACGKPIPQQ